MVRFNISTPPPQAANAGRSSSVIPPDAGRLPPATMATADGSVTPGPGPWADLIPDAAGIILQKLSLADRKSWQAVCRSWRELTRLQRPIPLLPLLVLANTGSSSLTLSNAMTAVRGPVLPQQQSKINCVGCSGGWVVVQIGGAGAHGEVEVEHRLHNLFSKQTLVFHPTAASDQRVGKFLAIANTVFFASYRVSAELDGSVPLDKVVYSCSPDTPEHMVAAAAADCVMLSQPKVARSWCICKCDLFTGPKDMVISASKLFLLTCNSGQIFVFHYKLTPDGPIVDSIERLVTDKLPVVPNCNKSTRHIMEWSGDLILVVRSAQAYNTWEDVLDISVYRLDLTVTPHQFIRLDSLDGNNLFVSSTSSKMFPANLYPDIQGDTIHSVDRNLESAVFRYQLPDGVTATIDLDIPDAINQEAARDNIFWVFRE